jgi:hypothetical protein
MPQIPRRIKHKSLQMQSVLYEGPFVSCRYATSALNTSLPTVLLLLCAFVVTYKSSKGRCLAIDPSAHSTSVSQPFSQPSEWYCKIWTLKSRVN